jgi:hypothetical protein
MCKVLWIVMLSGTTAWAGLSRLQALSMIESGDNDAAVGQAGEVSRYQIKPWVWREYSQSRAYRDARVSARVAEQYLADLEETFRKRARREPDDFDLYVLWNAGPAYYAKCGFSGSRVHPIIRDRAHRFVNLRRMQQAVSSAGTSARMLNSPVASSTDFASLLQPLPPLGGDSIVSSISPLPLAMQPAQTTRTLNQFTVTPADKPGMLAIGGIPAQ